MSAPQQTQTQLIIGHVKQVLSGDTVVIKGTARAGPPRLITFSFSSLSAPKLAKRAQKEPQKKETEDEPWAWESREFLRKKVIGQMVCFSSDKPPGAKEYGVLYLGKDTSGENLNEKMIEEGLVRVREDSNRAPSAETQRLLAIQKTAIDNHKGMHEEGANKQDHVRKITWNPDATSLLDKYRGKPVKAVVENVRDGATIRAFLLPEHIYITLTMSGIRCTPQSSDFNEMVKFFTECRLLQQDVEIILDNFSGGAFIGTIRHPKGNIAEELLKVGYAKLQDWSVSTRTKGEMERLKQAERMAKEKKLGIWKDWTPPPQQPDKEFTGIVMEIVNADGLIVKQANGNMKKIFLASIRPPRTGDENGPKAVTGKPGGKLTKYDIPWLFEAKEFLRKKLIGKKVNVVVDFVQPARETYQEKCCCTVTIGGVNIAEAMVAKGLATVLKYRQDDDQRASAYSFLQEAERKAEKNQKGVHAKKDVPIHRVNDYCGESAKAKQLVPHLLRDPQLEAVVEYVASGSRLRLFIPKHSSLVILLLSGIEVRYSEGDGVNNEAAALQFTREKCMQRDVVVKVEGSDRVGNLIGWLWVEGVNLSVALVEAGLAKIHFSGENSEYARLLHQAKASAQANGLWKYDEREEVKEVIEEDSEPVERKVERKEVVVIVVKELQFYCQFTSQEAKLSAMRARLAQEMKANPPLPGSYVPKKGDTCAAKYEDGEWYRARVEKISGNHASVFYIDYGNKEEVATVDCAQLPPGFNEKGFASCFTLACLQLPKDDEYKKEAELALVEELTDKTFLMNVEESIAGEQFATLVDPKTEEDVAKKLISEGYLLVDKKRERKLKKLVAEYNAAELEARKNRVHIWEYGDIREDEDKEFGLGR